jgi:phosphopantetheinyl transferase
MNWFEQSLDQVPVHDEWLAHSELPYLQRLHFPKRISDWRLGRWTAKRAVATVLQLPEHGRSLKEIAILAESSGAPRAFIANQPAPVSISLSHRDGVAVCAVAQSTVLLGCDLELVEARSATFIADYFTHYEHNIIAHQIDAQRDRIVTILWSAKESALKALQVGLRADTRSVEVRLCAHDEKPHEQPDGNNFLPSHCSPGEWHPFQAHCQEGQVLYGWWSVSGCLVKTMATGVSTRPPTSLAAKSFDYSPCTT